MAEPKIKITVVKVMDMNEIYGAEELGVTPTMSPLCEFFRKGQEFILDFEQNDPVLPRGFCPGAFMDIYRWIHALRFGANFHWIKEKGKVVVCCTDGLRPVVFRLERIE